MKHYKFYLKHCDIKICDNFHDLLRILLNYKHNLQAVICHSFYSQDSLYFIKLLFQSKIISFLTLRVLIKLFERV